MRCTRNSQREAARDYPGRRPVRRADGHLPRATGRQVQVFERRPDLRKSTWMQAARSTSRWRIAGSTRCARPVFSWTSNRADPDAGSHAARAGRYPHVRSLWSATARGHSLRLAAGPEPRPCSTMHNVITASNHASAGGAHARLRARRTRHARRNLGRHVHAAARTADRRRRRGFRRAARDDRQLGVRVAEDMLEHGYKELTLPTGRTARTASSAMHCTSGRAAASC